MQGYAGKLLQFALLYDLLKIFPLCRQRMLSTDAMRCEIAYVCLLALTNILIHLMSIEFFS